MHTFSVILHFLIKKISLSIVFVVAVVINFSHLHLQNHRVLFQATWHKASFGDEESGLFKWNASHFSKGRQLQNSEKHWQNFKNWANFNQNYNNASLGEGDSSLRYSENTLIKFKTLLQNHWTNFNQTWYRAILSEANSSLIVQIKAPSFSKGR